MSTLAEIESAAAELSVEELEELERRVQLLKAVQKRVTIPFTGHDAVLWWAECQHLPETEADAFARDVEDARREMNRPAPALTWA